MDSEISLPTSPAVIRYPARLISDLHLGHEISTIKDVRQLLPLLEGIATLILNGDSFEARLPRFQGRSAAMLAEFQAMAAAQNVTLVFINGNHDPSHWPLDHLDLSDGKIFVTHGHVLLPMVSPWSSKLNHCRDVMEKISAEYSPEELRKLESRFDRTRRWSEAMIATEVRQSGTGRFAKLGMAVREIWPPRRPWNVAKVWTMLPWIASRFATEFRPESRVMLFGHTHRAAWWRRKGRLLVNTGGFITFASPLAVDFKNERSVSIRRVVLRENEFRPGPEVTREEW